MDIDTDAADDTTTTTATVVIINDDGGGGGNYDHALIAQRFCNFVNTMKRLEGLEDEEEEYKRVVPEKQPQRNYPRVVPNETYIRTHLKHVIDRLKKPDIKYYTRKGHRHTVINKRGRKDNRVQLPPTISRAINDLNPPPLWGKTQSAKAQSCKVEVKWIICYLHYIMPDIKEDDDAWKSFECSHLCVEAGLQDQGLHCIDPNCLYWESKSTNQNRGHNATLCVKECTHCGDFLCDCQNIHFPPCR